MLPPLFSKVAGRLMGLTSESCDGLARQQSETVWGSQMSSLKLSSHSSRNAKLMPISNRKLSSFRRSLTRWRSRIADSRDATSNGSRDEVLEKVTETSLSSAFKGAERKRHGPNDTEQTKLSDKESREANSRRTQRQRRKSVLLRYLPHLSHHLRRRISSARTLAVEKVASHIKKAHSNALT